MKEKGFLFLPTNFNAFSSEEALEHVLVEFVRWSDLTRSVDKHIDQITLESLSEHLLHYPVDQLTVILPPASVSMMDVIVPTKKSRQLKQALPFIVEEQAAQDPDSLVLVSDYKPSLDNKLNVIAVDRRLLENVLDMLKTADLEAVDVFSIEQLLPTLEQQLLIISDGESAFLSQQGARPIHLPTKQIPWVLKKFNQTDQDGLLNIKLVITSSSALSYTELQELVESSLPEGTSAEFYSDKIEALKPYLVSFAATGSNNSSYYQSLLVDAYKPKKKNNQWLSLLAPTLVFGAFVLCCHLGLTLYNGWQYQQKANELQAQIYSTVKKAIPSAKLSKLKSDRALRSKIKSTLAGMSTDGGSPMLGHVTSDIISALSSYSKGQAPYVQRLSYRAATGETQLELHANSFAQVDQFKDRMSKSGYLVTVGAVTNDNGLFKGRLILQAKES
jgi:type II secretion system protein L